MTAVDTTELQTNEENPILTTVFQYTAGQRKALTRLELPSRSSDFAHSASDRHRSDGSRLESKLAFSCSELVAISLELLRGAPLRQQAPSPRAPMTLLGVGDEEAPDTSGTFSIPDSQKK
ncbi:hypothetical protein MRX96_038675 [Rhipicephalus microplus]